MLLQEVISFADQAVGLNALRELDFDVTSCRTLECWCCELIGVKDVLDLLLVDGVLTALSVPCSAVCPCCNVSGLFEALDSMERMPCSSSLIMFMCVAFLGVKSRSQSISSSSSSPSAR